MFRFQLPYCKWGEAEIQKMRKGLRQSPSPFRVTRVRKESAATTPSAPKAQPSRFLAVELANRERLDLPRSDLRRGLAFPSPTSFTWMLLTSAPTT